MQSVQLNEKLSFDQYEPETKLAKAYFAKNAEFYSPSDETRSDEYKVEKDSYGNTINMSTTGYRQEPVEIRNGAEMINVLIGKISENADLFAQIENLIRGIPQSDIKKYDIPLMLAYLGHYSFMWSQNAMTAEKVSTIKMMNETPLCTLAMVVYRIYKGYKVCIWAQKDAAVICHLFVNLAYEAGFDTDLLQLVFVGKSVPILYVSFEVFESSFTPLRAGALAAVTEQADVRTAVSALLDATTTFVYPWRLRRVFVQENIYDKFQSVLAENATPLNELNENYETLMELKTKSAGLSCYRNKVMALDCTIDTENVNSIGVVLVEAYRTTKELLSLMGMHDSNYLSLWCNDISTANEISLLTGIANVWINDFGNFEGPAPIAPSFYNMHDFETITFRQVYGSCNFNNNVEKAIQVSKTKRANWKKNDFEKRRRLIIDILLKYENTENKFPVDEIINELKTWHPRSLTEVHNNKVCLCLNDTKSLCIVTGPLELKTLVDVIKYIAAGNAVITCDDRSTHLLEFLSENGKGIDLPLSSLIYIGNLFMIFEENVYSRFKDVYLMHTKYGFDETSWKSKFIWYHYGETFAN